MAWCALTVAVFPGCVAPYQPNFPSARPEVRARPPQDPRAPSAESRAQFSSFSVGRMFPEPGAYVVEIRFDLRIGTSGPVTVRARGSTERGERGPLALTNPGSGLFSVASGDVPQLVLARPGGRASTSARVRLPWEWVRRSGAELTLTLSAHGRNGGELARTAREVHVPPPPPLF